MLGGLDAALEWLTGNKIPLGEAISGVVDQITQGAPWLFDLISGVLGALVLGFTGALQWVHPLLMVGLVCALAWYLQRSARLTVFVGAALLLIINMGYWARPWKRCPWWSSPRSLACSLACPLALLPRTDPGWNPRCARCWI